MNSDVSSIQNNGSRTNIDFGLSIDQYFVPQYAFSTGLSITNMGGSLVYTNGKSLNTSEGTFNLLANSQVDYQLEYIHIPFAVKMRTPQMGFFSFFAQLGFDPMINVQARANINGSTISGSINKNNEGVGQEVYPIYLGYHISAGLTYRIAGSTSLLAGLTYINGFTDVTNEGPANVTMSGLEIRIGVLF
jgi:hypothetical protein